VDPFALWDSLVVQAIFVRALDFLYIELGKLGFANWGVAIIVFTVIVKTLTLPLTLKSLRSTRRMQLLQPQLQQLQKQYRNDKERLMQEQMALYREHGVNPVAGCLPMIVQMPIWIALYSALFHLAGPNGHPEFARPFLWIPNLGVPEFEPQNFPSQLPILAVLTGVTQWITTKMAMQPSTDPQQQTMNQVMQWMPLMFIFFSFNVPAGLVLYWVTSNVYQMIQQYFISGWGMLRPATAGANLNVPPPRPQPASRPSAPKSTAKSSDGKGDAQAVKTPSNDGRRRRNKRR
jgi:YidC/Oxa1 family membrane protein insertase